MTSLSVSGTPAAQYVGEAPDLTGLTFTAVYSDSSEEPVAATDITATPATWSVSGSATMTCSYTEDETTVSANVTVEVHENFEVAGTMATQYANRNVDITGLSFTYNGEALDPSDVMVSPVSWTASGQGQTVTFSYDGDSATETTDVLRTVASLPVTHTSDIPVATARSADVYEQFNNVLPVNVDGNTKMYFVIDVGGGTFAPVSLAEGDYVFWAQDAADYRNDEANGCDATYVQTMVGLTGLDGSSLNFGPSPLGVDAESSDFNTNMPMTGSYTAAADTEVCWVLGRAKGAVANATTLKPSDVDLLAVWDVTYTV